MLNKVILLALLLNLTVGISNLFYIIDKTNCDIVSYIGVCNDYPNCWNEFHRMWNISTIKNTAVCVKPIENLDCTSDYIDTTHWPIHFVYYTKEGKNCNPHSTKLRICYDSEECEKNNKILFENYSSSLHICYGLIYP